MIDGIKSMFRDSKYRVSIKRVMESFQHFALKIREAGVGSAQSQKKKLMIKVALIWIMLMDT